MAFKKGQSGNPGGMTPELAAARKLVNAKLTDAQNVETWFAAYMQAVRDGQPTVLLDYGNRLLGKVKEEAEVSVVNALVERARELSDEELERVWQATLPADAH